MASDAAGGRGYGYVAIPNAGWLADPRPHLWSRQALGNTQCHQPKLQPCPRQAPRSSQPPWPSGDDQASAAQSGGLAGLAVM